MTEFLVEKCCITLLHRFVCVKIERNRGKIRKLLLNDFMGLSVHFVASAVDCIYYNHTTYSEKTRAYEKVWINAQADSDKPLFVLETVLLKNISCHERKKGSIFVHEPFEGIWPISETFNVHYDIFYPQCTDHVCLCEEKGRSC